MLGMLAQPPALLVEKAPADDARVLADGPQIQQVLLNLIKNAMDAGRDLPKERGAAGGDFAFVAYYNQRPRRLSLWFKYWG